MSFLKKNILRIKNITFRAFNYVLCNLRSKTCTYLYKDKGKGKIIFHDYRAKLKIKKAKNSTVILDGNLHIKPYMCNFTNSYIGLSDNSVFTLKGDFEIGGGVAINLAAKATLDIGGKHKGTNSGITENCKILVYKKVSIGKDCIFSWNTFVSDCDWHTIEGTSYHKNTEIGDNVWLTSNVNILKGTIIENGSIIATGSTIQKIKVPEKTLFGGNPPKILKSDINWNREIE